MPLKKSRVVKAGMFAAHKHKDELKRSTNTPYIKHPISAAKILRELMQRHKKELLSTKKGQKIYSNREYLISALLLHDVPENIPSVKYTHVRKKFGPKIAGLVREVTSNKAAAKIIGKGKYLLSRMQTMSSEALLMKLCDRLQNISDCHANVSSRWVDPGYMDKYVIQTRDIVDGIRPRIEKETILHQKIFLEIEKHLSQLHQEVQEYNKKRNTIK